MVFDFSIFYRGLLCYFTNDGAVKRYELTFNVKFILKFLILIICNIK